MRSYLDRFLIVIGVLHICIAGFSPAWGHLCDDIWRQKDKLIVKPEFQNLIMRDKAQFKVFLKNSMDRAIAEMSLEGKSKVFNIQVTPKKMQVPNNKKVFFNVTLTLKNKVSSGKYPIQFRLVAKGKTFKKFDMDTQIKKQRLSPPSPGPGPVKRRAGPSPITTHGISILRDTPSPDIDGDLHDSSWKKAVMFTDFKTTAGKRAASQTIVFLTADRNNIYFGFSCREKYPGQVQEDHVEIVIYPPGEKVCYTLHLQSDGTIKAYRTTPTSVQRSSMDISAKTVLSEDEKSWFAEIAIPVAGFGVKALKEGNTWRMNFTRERVAAGREISFWAGSPANFRNRDGCGKISFLGLAPLP